MKSRRHTRYACEQTGKLRGGQTDRKAESAALSAVGGATTVAVIGPGLSSIAGSDDPDGSLTSAISETEDEQRDDASADGLNVRLARERFAEQQRSAGLVTHAESEESEEPEENLEPAK